MSRAEGIGNNKERATQMDEMRYRAYMQCGAFFQTREIYGPGDGFNVDAKTGRLRVVVFDAYPASKTQQTPKYEDGTLPNCLGCTCRRASGRKEQRVFKGDAAGKTIHSRPVPLVTCLIARQEEAPAATRREGTESRKARKDANDDHA